MRIVHIASGDIWAGAERVLALLLEGIQARAGMSAEVLLFNEGRLADVLRGIGVPVHIIPESQHSFVQLVLATRRWLNASDPDVVHAHRYKEMLATSLAIAPWKRGFVATVHGLEPANQLSPSRALLIWGSLAATKLAGAQLVAVSGELTRRLQRRLGRRRILHIPNPLPLVRNGDAQLPDIRRKCGWPSSKPLVGFVGRLEHVKGPDIFVEIAARCHMDAAFVLLGGGSLAPELAARVTAAGLTKRVVLLGEVPDAAPYIRQFDVLALTSRHEGFPLVLLEAASSAVPIVAFDVGGVREVLHKSGSGAQLIAPNDWDSFRVALDTCLGDPKTSRTQAARGAEFIRTEFSLSNISSRYRDVYQIAARRAR